MPLPRGTQTSVFFLACSLILRHHEEPAPINTRRPLTRRVRQEVHAEPAAESALRPGSDWSWAENIARLPMEVFAPCRLAVDLADVPADGAVVELQINGFEVGVFSARPNSTFRPEESLGTLEPGLHLVQLSTLAGRPVRPVAARCS